MIRFLYFAKSIVAIASLRFTRPPNILPREDGGRREKTGDGEGRRGRRGEMGRGEGGEEGRRGEKGEGGEEKTCSETLRSQLLVIEKKLEDEAMLLDKHVPALLHMPLWHAGKLDPSKCRTTSSGKRQNCRQRA